MINNSASRLPDPNEGDRAAVRRPDGRDFVSRVIGQAQWRPRSEQFDVNVRLAALSAIPGEGQLIAVG